MRDLERMLGEDAEPVETRKSKDSRDIRATTAPDGHFLLAVFTVSGRAAQVCSCLHTHVKWHTCGTDPSPSAT